MTPLWITLLGGPGAGKTTVGKALEGGTHPELGDVHYISGSRLLEEYIEDEGEGWQEVKENKNRGQTADPRLTHRLLAERFESISDGGVVLLDGFPKTRAEADITEKTLPGGDIDLAVLLNCRANERAARISKRLVCGRCGTVERLGVGVGQVKRCPGELCDGLLQPREDDAPAALQHRESAEPPEVLAQHFREGERLQEVDANGPEGEVIEAVAIAI